MTQNWYEVDAATRLAHMGRVVVRTPKVKAGLKALTSTYQRYHTRAEGTGLLFTGDTRSGKTTTLNEFLYDLCEEQGLKYVRTTSVAKGMAVGKTAVTYLERRLPGEDLERPVLCIQVGERMTFSSLFRDVLTAVTEKKPAVKADHGELVLELCTQLIGQKTRLIIFDDVNNIADHRGKEGLHGAAEVPKLLMKIARVQVALVGMDSAAALLRSNKQLDEMVPRRYQLDPYARPGNDGETEFTDFLGDLKVELPFDQPCPIDTPSCALRLHIFTEGRPGALSLLLTDAVEYALENDLPVVNQDVFAMVLKEHRRVPNKNNIFMVHQDELSRLEVRARQKAIKPLKPSA